MLVLIAEAIPSEQGLRELGVGVLVGLVLGLRVKQVGYDLPCDVLRSIRGLVAVM